MSPRWDARRFSELDTWLKQALDLAPDARRSFLAELPAGRAAELAPLLASAEDEGDAICNVLDARIWTPIAGDPAAGLCFGAWRALGTLAHGGMARVLLAERADGAFQQHAAIKTLWPGIATPELVGRFEQERQILARLDDPRIARLLDGGVGADGVPWLALEYVDGQPLGSHCDDGRLDVDARLALWIEIAGAVAAAHRQLIVHRDLKPANVMVSRSGAVKLLDFGIAKLLDADGFPNAAPPTRTEGRALTRLYASPEQLRGDPVTTQSDVYQLGLLLYELLTGVQPFRADAGVAIERIPRPFDEPGSPSSIARRGADADVRAAVRGTNAARLSRLLRGDLDAIILRALAVRPDGRYGSVDLFCDDVHRWQRGLPVRARRTGALRSTGKWVRRHALGVTTAAVLGLTGVAYTATSLIQSRAIARESAINRAVRDYLARWLQAADLRGSAGHDPRASEMLSAGLARARHDLATQPELQAEILDVVGEVYLGRGEYANAEPVLREAVALDRGPAMRDSPHRGGSAAGLAMLLHFSGRYDEAETMMREALAMRVAALGERGYWSLLTRESLADLLHTRGLYDEARREIQRALSGALATLGDTDLLTAAMRRNLGDIDRDSGRFDEAEAAFRQALAVQVDVHGEMHVNTAGTRLSFGRLLLERGRYDEAAQQLEPAFDAYRQMSGESNPATAYWERVIAELEEVRGDLDGARARLARIETSMRAQLPETHLLFGYFAIDTGFVEIALGHPDEAARQFVRARHVFEGIQPKGHPRCAEILLGEALVARAANDDVRMGMLLDQAATEGRRALVADHPLFAAIDDVRGSPLLQTRAGLSGLRVARALAADRRAQDTTR